MTKQETITDLLNACKACSARTMNIPQSVLKLVDCVQLVAPKSGEYVEVEREVLMAALQPQPKKSAKSDE
jgi:hypothetical protein